MAGASTPVRLLVLDCAAMSDIDYSGAATLRQLSEELAPAGTRMVLTELSANARATVESMGLEPDVSVVARLEDAVRSGPAAVEEDQA